MAQLIDFSKLIFQEMKDRNRYESISKKDSHAINARLSEVMLRSKRAAEQKQASSRTASAKITLNS